MHKSKQKLEDEIKTIKKKQGIRTKYNLHNLEEKKAKNMNNQRNNKENRRRRLRW